MVNHGDPSVNHPVWESIHARQYISLVSLVCLVWEHVLTISHEYKYIWKSRLTITKWLYLFLRYLAIGFQLANHFVAMFLLSKLPLSKSACLSWFVFQASYLQVVQTLFELILLVRVWALYNKSRRIGVFLSGLYLLESAVMIYSIIRINTLLQFDGTCLVKETPMEAYFLALSPLVTQAVIWTMTWYKQINHSMWFGTNGPITTLMFRDGLIAFLLITSILPIFLSYSVYVHDLTHSVWTILVAIYSIGGCRIIMNMQRLKIPHSPMTSEIELTSYIATSCTTTGIDFSRQVDDDDEEDGTRAEFPI